MKNLLGFGFALLFANAFGVQFGYAIYFPHDLLSAQIYGYPTAFIAGMIIWPAFLWPILRPIGNGLYGGIHLGQLAVRRKLEHTQPFSPKDPEAAIRDGYTFAYKGIINRDYSYQTGGRYRQHRVRNTFTVQRNTATLTTREVDAVIIFEIMAKEGRLDKKLAERLRFALAWGEGRCEFYHGAMKAPGGLFQQNGFKNFKDVVAAEAAELNLTTDAAVSTLYTVLQNAARARPPSPGAVKLLKRQRFAANADVGADQWS